MGRGGEPGDGDMYLGRVNREGGKCLSTCLGVGGQSGYAVRGKKGGGQRGGQSVGSKWCPTNI